MKRKVFVIGIDAGTFDVINPLIEQGLLPNLDSLIRAGVSAKLISTVPPVTPPAWTSFMTGKNPGKHGIFDFFAPPSHGYERPVLNAQYIKARTIWRILSDFGKKVGVINVPMTHPPEKVNGFIIPGMQYGLDSNGDFSYPAGLMKELKEAIGNYKVLYGDMISLYSDDCGKLLREWREIHTLREKAILYLMDRYEWDFFSSVFYSIDVIQHHFWKYYDISHPEYRSSEYSNIIPEFYQYIDSSIGKILEKLNEDTLVTVVSDHGAGPEHKAFYVNKWLSQNGFLYFKRKHIPLWKYKLPHFMYKVLRRSGNKAIEWTVPIPFLPVLARKVDPREGLRVHELIDWNKTKAYSSNHTEQGIYINLKGREPNGIVEPGVEYENVRQEISEKLLKVRDPENEGNVIEQIYKKEEVYDGPYTYFAPDLFVILKGGHCLLQKEIYHNKLFGKADKSSGTHRMEGIFIMKGPHVKSGAKVENLSIMDVAPTILYYFGVPVPDDMDGRILKDFFDASYLGENPPKYSKSEEQSTSDQKGLYGPNDSEKIRKILRDLGYMG